MGKGAYQLLLAAPREELATELAPLFARCGWDIVRVQPSGGKGWWQVDADTQLVVVVHGASAADRSVALTMLRAKPATLPTIIVGRRMINANERIEALEAGAHECVPLPVSTAELRARLNSLMRLLSGETMLESGRSGAALVRRHNLELWTKEHIAFHAGRPLNLSKIEFALLNCLVSNPSPVTREMLLRDVFGRGFDPGSNVVEVQIHRLRRKLQEYAPPLIVRTVRGQGYVLAAG